MHADRRGISLTQPSPHPNPNPNPNPGPDPNPDPPTKHMPTEEAPRYQAYGVPWAWAIRARAYNGRERKHRHWARSSVRRARSCPTEPSEQSSVAVTRSGRRPQRQQRVVVAVVLQRSRGPAQRQWQSSTLAVQRSGSPAHWQSSTLAVQHIGSPAHW